jgi:hypothetical protein
VAARAAARVLPSAMPAPLPRLRVVTRVVETRCQGMAVGVTAAPVTAAPVLVRVVASLVLVVPVLARGVLAARSPAAARVRSRLPQV